MLFIYLIIHKYYGEKWIVHSYYFLYRMYITCVSKFKHEYRYTFNILHNK